MKKLFVIFLIFLLPLVAFADVDTFDGVTGIDTWDGQTGVDTIDGQTVASGASDFCTDCSADDADRGCHSFPATGACSYTTSVAGTNTLAAEVVPGTDPCSETGRALEIDYNDTENDCYWYYDTGTTYTQVDIYGKIYLESESISTGNTTLVMQGDDLTAFNSRMWRIDIKDVDGSNYTVRLTYFDSDSAYTSVDGVNTFTTSQWATFEAHVSQGSPATISVDGEEAQVGAKNVGTRDGRYHWFGGLGFAFKADIAYIKFDDDTAPSACTVP